MVKSKRVPVETVLKVLVSLGEQVAELPTRNDVERIVEEAFQTNEQLKKIDGIAKEVKTISKAMDKDAETIVKHEKRIVRIETHLSLK